MSNKRKERRRTVSCGAVTYRVENGKTYVLLIKQFSNNDSWGIPKGHVNDGETLEDCAVREVREETGVTVKLGERLPDCHARLKNEDKTVVSYLATVVGDHEPKHDDPDNEVADAQWIPIDQLPKVHAYQQQLVATVVALLRERLRSSSE